MTDSQLIEYFINNLDLFDNNNIFSSILKIAGWLVVKGFVFLADIAEDLYDTTFGLVDFTTWAEGTEFMNALKPAFIGIMAVSLFALGIMLIMGHDKQPKIVQNICIACLCFTCSAVVFGQLNSLTMSFKEGIESIDIDGQTYDGAYDIVSQNLYDLVYLDQELGLKNVNYDENKESLPHPDLDKQSFSVIDYNEIINYDTENFDWNENGEAKKILKKQLLSLGDDSYKIKDVYNGIGFQSGDENDPFNEFYYRYKFDFFPALIQLAAIIVVYIAMSYKVVRLIIELFVGKLLAYLYSAELSGGQKITKILVFIRDTYILLLFTTILIRCFYFAMAFCQSRIENTLVECIIILFVAFVVIDGPNIVESLLGMDAGLSSSTARMMAIYHGAKAAAMTTTAPIRFAAHKAVESHRMNKYSGGNDRSERDRSQTEQRDTQFMDDRSHDERDRQRSEERSQRDRENNENRGAADRTTDSRHAQSDNNTETRDMSFMEQDQNDREQESLYEREEGSGQDSIRERSFMDDDRGTDIQDSRSNDHGDTGYMDSQREAEGEHHQTKFDDGERGNNMPKTAGERGNESVRDSKSMAGVRTHNERTSFMDERQKKRTTSADTRRKTRYDSDILKDRRKGRKDREDE